MVFAHVLLNLTIWTKKIKHMLYENTKARLNNLATLKGIYKNETQ